MPVAPGKPVGFVGLGNMGGRMSRRLVQAGHEVLGFDLDAQRCQACGARAAGSLGQIARETDVMLMSLPDSTAVEAVVQADDGLLANARPGQVIVDLSTAAPSSTRRLAQLLATCEVSYIDAGISGGAAAADKGTLTLMVGGEAQRVDELRGLFAAFSSKVVHMGPS
ncbi:MAG: NAD(P)-binding domain-containing protein, partial [Quisquiliibacterium sp.]